METEQRMNARATTVEIRRMRCLMSDSFARSSPEHRQQIAECIDRGIGFNHSCHSRVSTLDCKHACSSRARDVYVRVVAHKNGSGGIDVEPTQRAAENRSIWLVDAYS